MGASSAAKYPTAHRIVPSTLTSGKNSPAPNVSGAAVEKPWSRIHAESGGCFLIQGERKQGMMGRVFDLELEDPRSSGSYSAAK